MQERQKMVEQVLHQGLSISAAKAAGVSRQSASLWAWRARVWSGAVERSVTAPAHTVPRRGGADRAAGAANGRQALGLGRQKAARRARENSVGAMAVVSPLFMETSIVWGEGWAQSGAKCEPNPMTGPTSRTRFLTAHNASPPSKISAPKAPIAHLLRLPRLSRMYCPHTFAGKGAGAPRRRVRANHHNNPPTHRPNANPNSRARPDARGACLQSATRRLSHRSVRPNRQASNLRPT